MFLGLSIKNGKFFNINLFIIILIFFIKSTSAFSTTWKKGNDECSIKTNHPELLITKPNCNNWYSNYQYIQTYHFENSELVFMGRLELAQPGYYWYYSGEIQKKLNQFHFIKDNVKFIKSSSNPVLSSNFWSKKPDNYDVIINNPKFNNIKCFGFWDASINSSSIGRRHNLYGMICNLKGNEISILKRKEYLNHIYLNHKYVSTSPKPWVSKNNSPKISKETIKTNKSSLENVVEICTELGYKPKSEKHADCVLKLIDKININK